MVTPEVIKYANLFIGMSDDYLQGNIKDEAHYVFMLKTTADRLNNEYFKTYYKDNEPIQTFIQYGNVVLERIGSNFYLRGLGRDFALNEFQVKKIMVELDYVGINQPLLAADHLAERIKNGEFDNYCININNNA